MITALLVGTVGRGIQSVLTPSDLTPCCKRILEESVSEARLLGLGSVGTEHILMALLKEKDSCAVRFIESWEPIRLSFIKVWWNKFPMSWGMKPGETK
jgi:ATP-dependent Clp protease ATP-binding subunit ClpA